jgi:hypothetical protein
VSLLGVALSNRGIERRRIDVKSRSRLSKVHNRQSNYQREGGDDFKVNQRLNTQASERLVISHGGDPMHHRAENDRRYDHFHQLDKSVSERLQRFPECRKKVTNEDAEYNARQDLQV